jgi:hypothetical protein
MQGGSEDEYLPSEDGSSLWTCRFCSMECSTSGTVPTFAARLELGDGAGVPALTVPGQEPAAPWLTVGSLELLAGWQQAAGWWQRLQGMQSPAC